MTQGDLSRRGSRFWLYTPFVLLAVLAVGWTVAWFVIRDRTAKAVDTALAREAAAGRQWTCPDRTIAGFPFRIEISCASLALAQGSSTLSLGPVLAVAQIYQPRHVIVQAAGPLQATDGQVTVSGDWDQLRASFRAASDGLQRISLVTQGPRVTVAGAGPDISARAGLVEAHLRPDPRQPAAEAAYDVAIEAKGAAVPLLDGLTGSAEPADLALDAMVTQGPALRSRTAIEGLERWRLAGGRFVIESLTAAKGVQRLKGQGELMLDEAHRPAGRIQIAAANLDRLTAAFGGNGAASAILGALTGRAANAEAGGKPNEPTLRPLPPIRLDKGRVSFGPLPVPGIQLQPLY